MGSSLIATCTACGYQTPLLMIGGGMANFDHLCLYPAYCAKGDHLLLINLFDHPCRCPKHRAPATPYGAPSFNGVPGPNRLFGWTDAAGDDERTAVLTDGRYFCPACHQTTLRFADGGR